MLTERRVSVCPELSLDILLTMAMQLTSITQSPDRLVNKGANFFRMSNANSGIFAHRRKSAVELLEASKSEYVKSTSVLNQRQELKHPEVLHIGTSRPKSAAIGSQPSRSKSDHELSSSDDRNIRERVRRDSAEYCEHKLEVRRKHSGKSDNSCSSRKVRTDLTCQNKLENQHLNLSPEKRKEVTKQSSELREKTMEKPPLKEKPEIKEKPLIKDKPVIKEKPLIREKPLIKEKPTRTNDFLLPNSYQSLSTSVTVLVEKRCASSAMSKHSRDQDVIRRKKKPLHRSQSDLSCRHSRTSSDFSDLSSRLSRTSTELERFFNEMGIDKSVLEPMIRLHDRRTKDSEMFESISSVESASNHRSTCSDFSQGETKDKQDKAETDKEIAERNSKETSIVEKNARIIKWLCNVKKARHPNQQAS
ncbi:hypothetical protein FSP39_001034 [Pinctada imbricata]|uniref:Centrosome-associated FAM110 C-terminal domain-containing protein n=1 Tax=Pinctada imbricata TaxID=66713 RepID=A0AA89BS25_PINIB|nr:hypothetical protein FSP39_001034 [Pinctada imbricata]